ncbi:MAG: ATP-grasp domain-containing protein [Bacilli bacterium]
MKIGLIAGRSGEALYRELKKTGKEIYLLAGNESDSGVDIALNKFICDFEKKKEIEEYLRKNNVKQIIVGTGHIKVLNLLEYLQKKGYKLSIELEKINLCKDKHKLKKELINLGYFTPKYCLYKNIAELEKDVQIKFPCVLKSTVDKFSPSLIRERKILLKKIEEYQFIESEIILEEYIEGNEISIPVINNGEQINILGIMNYSKGKDEKLEGFENLVVEQLNEEKEKEVTKLSLNLIKQLQVYGLSRIDAIIKEERIYILEINGIIVTGETNDDYTKIWKQKKMDFPKNLIACALKILENK